MNTDETVLIRRDKCSYYLGVNPTVSGRDKPICQKLTEEYQKLFKTTVDKCLTPCAPRYQCPLSPMIP